MKLFLQKLIDSPRSCDRSHDIVTGALASSDNEEHLMAWYQQTSDEKLVNSLLLDCLDILGLFVVSPEDPVTLPSDSAMTLVALGPRLQGCMA